MKRFLTIILLVALVAGVLWLARNPLAEWRASSRLESLGYVCDDLELHVEADFSRATIAPTQCTAESGPIERVELPEESTVALAFLRPREARVPTARFVLRRAVVDVETEGETFIGRSNVRGPIVRLLRLFDPSRASHLDRFEVDHVEVDLQQDVESGVIIAEGLVVEPLIVEEEPQDGVHFDVEAVRIPTRLRATLTFDELQGTLREDEASVDGSAGGAARLGNMEVSPSWGFRLRASDLGSARPRLHFESREP